TTEVPSERVMRFRVIPAVVDCTQRRVMLPGLVALAVKGVGAGGFAGVGAVALLGCTGVPRANPRTEVRADGEREWDARAAGVLGFGNVTVPGRLTMLHVVVKAPGGFGSPSSLAVPVRLAVAGSVIDWLLPALTVGGWFTATVIVTVALLVSTLSLAVNRST